MRTTTASNAQLVSAATTGSAVCWEELVRRFTGVLRRIAVSHGLDEATAADVVQSTWLRALERLHTLRDPEAVGGWLATTAHRESLSVLRGRRRERLIDSYQGLDRPDDGRTPEEEVTVRDQYDRLWEALSILQPRGRRLLLLLMASRSPSYAKVSAELDIPVGSIGPTRARTLAQLRNELIKAGERVPA